MGVLRFMRKGGKGNVGALADYVGRVGFTAALPHVAKHVTGGDVERAKRVVGKLKGKAKKRGTLAPEHAYGASAKKGGPLAGGIGGMPRTSELAAERVKVGFFKDGPEGAAGVPAGASERDRPGTEKKLHGSGMGAHPVEGSHFEPDADNLGGPSDGDRDDRFMTAAVSAPKVPGVPPPPKPKKPGLLTRLLAHTGPEHGPAQDSGKRSFWFKRAGGLFDRQRGFLKAKACVLCQKPLTDADAGHQSCATCRAPKPADAGKQGSMFAKGKTCALCAKPLTDADTGYQRCATCRKPPAAEDAAKQVSMFGKARARGEGSRGGKVIGHTRSGKPIYDRHDHPTHAEFTSDEHRDAVTEHKDRALDIADKLTRTRQGTVADKRLVAQRDQHKAAARAHEEATHIARERESVDPSTFPARTGGWSQMQHEDAIVHHHERGGVGSVVSSLQQRHRLAREMHDTAIGPAEFRPRPLSKMKAGDTLRHYARGTSDFVYKKVVRVENQQYTGIRTLHFDDGSKIVDSGHDDPTYEVQPGALAKASLFDAQRAFAKGWFGGEGSRGGRVIGHTTSGKAVYAGKRSMEEHEKLYKRFTPEDHEDAAVLHRHTGQDETAASDHRRSARHKRQKPSLFERFTSRLSGSENLGLDMYAASRALVKAKGEGSRGGHVIGHTQSGKPIYADKRAHEYKDFTAQDHHEAGVMHERESKGAANAGLRHRSATMRMGIGDAEAHHERQADDHFHAAIHTDQAEHAQRQAKSHYDEAQAAWGRGEHEKYGEHMRAYGDFSRQEGAHRTRAAKGPPKPWTPEQEAAQARITGGRIQNERIDRARDEAAKRNARDFGTDPSWYKKAGGGEGSRGGHVLGHTRSGHAIYLRGSTRNFRGKAQLAGITTASEAHASPDLIEHGGKRYVRAGHNSDTGGVAYDEHEPERHVIDTEHDFGDVFQPARLPAGGRGYSLRGLPKMVGGDLPDEIHDPHHGTLTIRGHNSDTHETIYHRDEEYPRWSPGRTSLRERALKVASIFDRQRAFAKGGEGSRGGHVIGHTKSGKAIYDTHDHPSHAAFTSEDHRDAAKVHGDAEYEALHPSPAGTRNLAAAGMERAFVGSRADKADHHRRQRGKHEDIARRAERAADRETPIEKPMGRAMSNKPIFDRFEHEAHKDFTPEEHLFAADMHGVRQRTAESRGEHEKAAHHESQIAPHIAASGAEGQAIIAKRTPARETPGKRAYQPDVAEPKKARPKKKPKSFSERLQGTLDKQKKRHEDNATLVAETRARVAARTGTDPGQQLNIMDLIGKAGGMGFFARQRAFLKAKGEGSRGGRVVGHTKSGKPIYGARTPSPVAHGKSIGTTRSGKNIMDYRGEHESNRAFTSEDHRDAADAHYKRQRAAEGSRDVNAALFHEKATRWHMDQHEIKRLQKPTGGSGGARIPSGSGAFGEGPHVVTADQARKERWRLPGPQEDAGGDAATAMRSRILHGGRRPSGPTGEDMPKQSPERKAAGSEWTERPTKMSPERKAAGSQWTEEGGRPVAKAPDEWKYKKARGFFKGGGTACTGCGKSMNPAEAMLGSVCGSCTKKRHAAVTSGTPRPPRPPVQKARIQLVNGVVFVG